MRLLTLNLLIFSSLAWGSSICLAFAAPTPQPKPKPECGLVVAKFDFLSSHTVGQHKISALSDGELNVILQRIQSDPSLREFHSAMVTLLRGSSNLTQSIKTHGTPESHFFLAYMKWLAYRSEKDKVISKAENQAKTADLDPALQRTNVMEIMDRLITQIVNTGERIPEPIVKLLNELLQGGIERIQTAADTWMLNGEIGTIVDTLDVLQSGQKIEAQSLYIAIMKLWDLDGGAPYAIQKDLAELTPQERAFFTSLDPNSKLTLPTRHYSRMDVDAIRWAYRGTPLSALSVEETDRAVAGRNRYMLGNDVLDKVKARFPNQNYDRIPVEEIDNVLRELGEITLIERAARMRAGFRLSGGEPNAQSLKGTSPTYSAKTALVPTQSSHPLALTMSLPAELVGYTNTAAQLPNLSEAATRLEMAIARMDHNSIEYQQSVEVYRTYLNMAMYAPHDINNGGGLFDVLAVAAVEVGDTKDKEDFSNLVHKNYKKIRALMWKAHYNQGQAFREVTLSLYNFINARQNWDEGTLKVVLEKLNWLAEFEAPRDLSREQADSILAEVTKMRHSEPLDSQELIEALNASNGPTRARHGTLTFKISIVNESLTGTSGVTASVHDLSFPENDSGEFLYDLHQLENFLKSYGATGYQIVTPTYHLSSYLSSLKRYTEVKSERRYGQHNAGIEEVTSFYFSFGNRQSEKSPSFNTSEVKKFLQSGSSRGSGIRVENFVVNLRVVDFNTMSPKQGKTLTLTQVDAEPPGSGKYESFLHAMEQIAKQHGFAAFIIEGVDNPRHWTFYEKRMKYSRSKRDSDRMRTYFVELN